MAWWSSTYRVWNWKVPRCVSEPVARGLGAELGDHEREVRVGRVDRVQVRAQLRGGGGWALQVRAVRVVPAEVLVHAQRVQVPVRGHVHRLAQPRLAIDCDQPRVVDLPCRRGGVPDVGVEAGTHHAQLGTVPGRLVGQRPGEDRGVVHVRVHGRANRPDGRVADARGVEEAVGQLVHRGVHPVEDPHAVQRLDERGMERVVRARDGGAEVAEPPQQVRARGR